MPSALGLDIGTSGVKAVIWDSVSGEIAMGQSRYSFNSWTDKDAVFAEQDPELWLAAVKDAVCQLPITQRGAIKAVGVTGQMHAFIATDKNGDALRPAMLWFDHRANSVAAELEAQDADLWRSAIGGPPHPDYPASKWVWEARNDRLVADKMKYLVQAKDWVKWKLGGVLATDPGEASGTGYYNPFTRSWDTRILERIGLDVSKLPVIMSSHAIVGEVSRDFSQRLGIPVHTPLINGTGDLPAAASLYPLDQDASILFNLGTAAQVVMTTSVRQLVMDLTILNHVDDRHLLIGVPLLAAGMALQWWTDMGGQELDSDSIDPGRVLFLPQIAGERDSAGARSGAFLGLTVYSEAAELTRSVLTGIVLALREARDQLVSKTDIMPKTYYIAGRRAFLDIIGPRLASAIGSTIYGLAVEEPSACGVANIALSAVVPPVQSTRNRTRIVFESSSYWQKAYDERYRLYSEARQFYKGFSQSLSLL
jgi:sugar (pentulose or hexulose) kinase